MSSVAYKTGLIDKVFFLRWERPPELEEIKQVISLAEQAYNQAQQPMMLVSVASSTTRVPNSDQRKNIMNALVEKKQLFCEWHVLLEGSELQQNVQRVIISGTLVIARLFDDRWGRVHKTADTIAPFISNRLGTDGAKVVATARAQGLVS